jgi:hypothetical protein
MRIDRSVQCSQSIRDDEAALRYYGLFVSS